MVALDDLTVEQIAALAAIVRGGPDPRRALAWTEAEQLWDDGHAMDTLAGLVILELVVEWSLAGVPQYTLTPYGAWLMGVKILERLSIIGEELEEDPYWAELDKEPPALHLPKRRHEIRWPWMDEFPDTKADQEEVVRDEEGEAVLLFGGVIRVDKRMAKGKTTKRRKAG